MIKKLLKIVNKKPKEGDIVETISPVLFCIQLGFAIFSGYISLKWYNENIAFSYFAMIFAILLAWQLGWGMKVTKFSETEKKKSVDNCTFPTLPGYFDGDLLDMQKISKMVDEMPNYNKCECEDCQELRSNFQVGKFYVHKYDFIYIEILYSASGVLDDNIEFVSKDTNNNRVIVKTNMYNDFVQITKSAFEHVKYSTKK